MELGDYLRIFVRRRWLVIGFAALGVIAAVLVTAVTPRSYSSQARLFVGTSSAGNNAQLRYAASQFTLQRMASYAQLDASGRVLDPVIRSLNLNESVRSLASRVTLTNPASTVTLDVSVTDGSPTESAMITNAVARQLSSVIESLERGDTAPAAQPVVVTVTKTATANKAAVSPQPVLNVGLGLLVGLILGALLAILREQFDRSVRTPDEGVRIAGIPVVGVIPRIRKLKDGDPRLAADPVTSSMRRIRSNLSVMHGGTRPRTVSVLSASDGDGRTTTAVAILLSAARSGLRSCLVEADLRRPRLADMLGVPADPGLADVLADRAELSTSVYEYGTNAWVLTAGDLAADLDAEALLESPAFELLLLELSADFDLVVVDVAATDADGLLVARRTQATLLVVRPGVTDRESLRATALRVDPAGHRATGLVINSLSKRAVRTASRYATSVVPLATSADPVPVPAVVPARIGAHRAAGFESTFLLPSPNGREHPVPASRRASGTRPRYQRHITSPADVSGEQARLT